MNILKYYSIGFIISDILISMYQSGKEEDILGFIITITCLVPVLICLILS